MRHLLISREFPPAPAGGIGAYTAHIARLLAESGETVHVIGQRWAGADIAREERLDGRLIVHRVPYDDWNALLGARPHAEMQDDIPRQLFRSSLPAQAFAWQAALVAEAIVESESIDVIEAQEYEAPAYFLAMRRAHGLGPSRKPPIVVHLHSPTEFIARHNEWDPAAPSTLLASRLERSTFETADAWLCPSAYLARTVEARHGMEAGTIRVIPLPYSDRAPLVRTPGTWKNGPIVYVGRLERRKGVLEWLDAAVQVAGKRSDVTFEFIGGNVLGTGRHSGEAILDQKIPGALRARFRFHGHGRREGVIALLARARISVVPSRWENFPYTCVEAMASGLPVLASPEGGMAEMIEDGRTGWISAAATPAALAATLERALATPPARLAGMGEAASVAIRHMCDPQRVTAQHMEFKRAVLERGPHRSSPRPALDPAAGPIAVILVDRHDPGRMERTLSSLAQQGEAAGPVIIVRSASPADTPPDLQKEDDSPAEPGARYYDVTERRPAAQKNRAAQLAIRLVRDGTGADPLALLFLEPGIALDPGVIATCRRVLLAQARAGVVGGWTRTRAGLRAPPQPSFPHQLLHNDVGQGAAIRAQAFAEVGGFAEDIADGLEDWDLTNRIMARGWAGLAVPAVFAIDGIEQAVLDVNGLSPQQALLERIPDVVARHAQEIAVLAAAAISRSVDEPPPWAPPTLGDVIGFAVRHPLRTAARLRERVRMHLSLRAADRRAARNGGVDTTLNP